MDAVRLGRALGLGARQAVKTMSSTVDAAAASNSAPRSASGAAQSTQPDGFISRLRRAMRRFVEAAWRPVVRLSAVLWLEVTGVFFGIFALFALNSVWRLRAQWHLIAAHAPGESLFATHSEAEKQLLGALAMLAIFGYFCVSSFIRARRRERQR